MDEEQRASDWLAEDAWGRLPDANRQHELEALLAQQQAWVQSTLEPRNVSKSVFKGEELTGADVYFLSALTLAQTEGDREAALDRLLRARENLVLRVSLNLADLHLEGANLIGAYLHQAVLNEAQLESTILVAACLEGASLSGARLERAQLQRAHLEGADLGGAYLMEANLEGAYLEGAHFEWAHLDGATLMSARLAGAQLIQAHLEDATLGNAGLGGKAYSSDDSDYARIRRWVENFPLSLPPADLRGAFLDRGTRLANITLGTSGAGPGQGFVLVADVRWGGANLAVIKDWPADMVLGDEHAAWVWQPPPQSAVTTTPITKAERASPAFALGEARHPQEKAPRKQLAQAVQERLDLFRAAVRANRQLAMALREQGMNETADRFSYRAQVCQRQLFRLQCEWGRWFLQTLLGVVAGYGMATDSGAFWRPTVPCSSYSPSFIG